MKVSQEIYNRSLLRQHQLRNAIHSGSFGSTSEQILNSGVEYNNILKDIVDADIKEMLNDIENRWNKIKAKHQKNPK